MRRRILTSMVGVAAVAIVLFALPLGLEVGRLYKSHEVTRLEREATRAVVVVPASGPRDVEPGRIPIASHGVTLGYYDLRDRLVAGAGPRDGGRDVASALTGHVSESGGATLSVSVPIPDEDTVIGAARAAEPMSDVNARTYSTWAAMFVLGVLALVVAAMLGRRQARKLSLPINDIESLAVRLGDGDFAASIDPHDVPELARAADALNQTAIRLGDMMTRERSFTADVTHQLATPLTSLRLGLESALLTPGVDHRAAIEAAVNEVERLQRTVTTVLALARDSLTGAAVCDVVLVCAQIGDRHRAALATAGRSLSVELDESTQSAACSPDVLREILEVLMDNAERHGHGNVALRARSVGRGVVIEVEDEGPGIDGDTARIFRRRAEGATGHGIGLALARALADVQGARLRLTRAAPHPVFSLVLIAADVHEPRPSEAGPEPASAR